MSHLTIQSLIRSVKINFYAANDRNFDSYFDLDLITDFFETYEQFQCLKSSDELIQIP